MLRFRLYDVPNDKYSATVMKENDQLMLFLVFYFWPFSEAVDLYRNI